VVIRSVTCTRGIFEVVDSPPPRPQPGQLLLDVLYCGICGSDLHARWHGDELAAVSSELGYDGIFRSDQPVVLGHEVVGRVAGHGRRSRRSPPVGALVVAMPLLRHGGAVHPIGLSVAAPGGYAEQVLVEESLAFVVPDGLAAEVAALTEPLAVGLHAVRRSGITRDQVAIVLGCGPVGLAVVGMLKARGVRTVVASDFSSTRRRLATRSGADLVVDPTTESPYTARADGHLRSAPEVLELAVGAMERLRRLPLLPWQRVLRAADLLGLATPRHPVIFECVGVPGMIDAVVSAAPLFSRVVVVGVCMPPDTLRPAMAINKEIDLRFVLGYTPGEFHDTLRLLATGKVDARHLVTGQVGLAGVDAAFTALNDPDAHAKILVNPRSAATGPVPVGPADAGVT
jgi:threonine dehydrogenase-like Zn-dependent dehydrogenase